MWTRMSDRFDARMRGRAMQRQSLMRESKFTSQRPDRGPGGMIRGAYTTAESNGGTMIGKRVVSSVFIAATIGVSAGFVPLAMGQTEKSAGQSQVVVTVKPGVHAAPLCGRTILS